MNKIRMRALSRIAPCLVLVALAGLAQAQERSTYFDPETMIGVDEIEPGMKGVCYSVFRGTEPEPFNVEILNVVRNLDPGVSYVMMRMLDGPCVANESGPAGGMSGSPIYIDGRIAGALSRGPSTRQPLVMFTPIEYMLRSFENIDRADAWAQSDPAAVQVAELDNPVIVDGAERDLAVLCLRDEDVPEEIRDRAVAFVPCAPSISVSGLSDRCFEILRKVFDRQGMTVMQSLGGVSELPPYELVPGSPVGVGLMTGDIAIGAAGTLTYVDGDRFLAFGHPMFSAGMVDLPATYNEVIEVIQYVGARSEKMDQPLAVAPFGTILTDDPQAIGGQVGRSPTMFPLRLTVTAPDLETTKTYNCNVCRDETYSGLMPAMAALSALEPWVSADEDFVIQSRIRAEGKEGAAVELETYEHTDVGPTSLPAMEAMTAVSILMTNIFSPQDVASLSIDFTITERKAEARLLRLELDDWVVAPGDSVKARVVYQLIDGLGLDEQTIEIPIPADAPSGSTTMVLAAGEMAAMAEMQLGFTRPTPVDLPGLIESYTATAIPNNRLVATLGMPGSAFLSDGRSYPSIPSEIAEILTQAGTTDYSSSTQIRTVTWETEYDIQGMLQHPLVIVRPEDRVAAGNGAGLVGGPMVVGSVPTISPALEGPALQVAVAGRLSRLSQCLDAPPALWTVLGDVDPRLEPLTRGLDKTEALKNVYQSFPAIWSLFMQGPPPPGIHMPEGAEPGKVKVQETTVEPTEAETGETVEGEGDGEDGEEDDAEIEPIAVRQPGAVSHTTTDDFRPGALEGVSILDKGALGLANPLRTVLDYCAPALYAWCLAPDGVGGVYVGTGPQGTIYRVSPEGECSVFFDTDDAQVFALQALPDGTLVAGAGPSGKLYHISANGKEMLSGDTGEAYVWDIAFTGDAIVAATGPNGRVLRVTESGDVTEILNATEDHALCVTVDDQGDCYVGTDSGALYRVAPDGVVNIIGKSPLGAVYSIGLGPDGDVYFGSLGNAYKITETGSIEAVIETPDMGGLALATAGERLYFATNQTARLYSTDAEGNVGVLGAIEQPEAAITSLCADPTGDALWALTSAPIGVYRMPVGGEQEGSYTSSVLAAPVSVEWSTVEWQGAAPEGATVTVETRTGNTPRPDERWSDWCGTQGEGRKLRVYSPDGMYLQYRVRLGSDGGAGPEVASVTLEYLTPNNAPTVAYEDISEIKYIKDTAELSWEGTDPDSDTLRYAVAYSADNGLTWTDAKTNLAESTYSWDVSEIEEGAYLLKITASDEPSNPGAGLDESVVVGPVYVDTTAPAALFGNSSIEIAEDGTVTIKGAASDKGTGVKVAQYSVDDEEPWNTIAPRDLRYDETHEMLTFVLAGLEPGDRSVRIAVFDRAGNQTVTTLTVTIPGEVVEDEPAEETTEEEETPAEGAVG